MTKIDTYKGIEPRVRIGLILPEDKLSNISLVIPDHTTNLYIDDKKIELSGNIEVTIVDQLLEIGPYTGKNIMVKSGRLDTSDRKIPEISPVVAGRKFHWETSLKVSCPGYIEIRIKDGYIFAVNILYLEDYLACVATSEMSSSCPSSFIQAQTICARSWFLAGIEDKHNELGIDACNDDCCQRYQGAGFLTESALSGARITAGIVLSFNGLICDTRYSKSCGGIIEDYITAWNTEGPDYLRAHPDSNDADINLLSNEKDAESWIRSNPKQCFCSPATIPENELKTYIGSVDRHGEYFRWKKDYSGNELLNILNSKLNLGADSIQSFIVLRRGASGRISRLKIGFTKNGNPSEIILESELEIRQTLDSTTLYSSALIFDLDHAKSGQIERIRISGAGWGHGVGLCQIGALGMSLKDYNSTQILNHYYPGTNTFKLY